MRSSFDLRFEMAIADLPGECCQMPGIARTHLKQRLRRGLDQYDAPVFQHQSVAMPEMRGLGQIEQEAQAAIRGHRHAAAMTRLVIERDRIDRLAIDDRARLNAIGAQHVRTGNSAAPWAAHAPARR